MHCFAPCTRTTPGSATAGLLLLSLPGNGARRVPYTHARTQRNACVASSPSRCGMRMGESAKARVYLAGSVIHGHASALLQLLQHVALAHVRGLSHTTPHSRPERSMATGANTQVECDLGLASLSHQRTLATAFWRA